MSKTDKINSNSYFKFIVRILRNTILLIALYFSLITPSLLGQDKSSDSLAKIFIAKVDIPGLNPDYQKKIQNSIQLNLLKHFRNQFRILDDEYISNLTKKLQIKQQIGCSADLCMKQLEDAIEANYKITASLEQAGGGDLKLSLKLYKIDAEGGGLENAAEKTIKPFQLDYYLEELVKYLPNKKYAINDKDAPQDFGPTKVDLSNVKVKEVTGIDLKIMTFKTDDQSAKEIINENKSNLQEADNKFTNKNYKEAITNYKTILDVLDGNLREESKKKIAEYIKGINLRIENSWINIYTDKINQVDLEFDKVKDNLDEKQLDSLVKKYTDIQKDYTYPPTSGTNQVIIKGLADRLEKFDLAKAGIIEKKADEYYERYEFTSAFQELKRVEELLKDKPKNPANNKYREKIVKKLTTTKITGLSHLENKVKSLSDLAERKNITYEMKKIQDKKKEMDEANEIIKQSMEEARKTLINSEFKTKELVEYYNKVADLIIPKRTKLLEYKPKRIGAEEEKRIVTPNEKKYESENKTGKTDSSSNNTSWSALWRSALIPVVQR